MHDLQTLSRLNTETGRRQRQKSELLAAKLLKALGQRGLAGRQLTIGGGLLAIIYNADQTIDVVIIDPTCLE